MIKKIILYIFLFSNVSAIGQNDFFNIGKSVFLKDTVVEKFVIFDYFRQEYDSKVYLVGSYLMPSDSLSFTAHNKYRIEVSKPKNGYLKIYFKNKLLYQYRLIKNEINGEGICFFPFTGDVALQGRFSNGKLHGFVFVQEKNGEMIELMKYREGKYVKHLYHWLSFSKRNLRKRSKGRSDNPLRGDEAIIR